MSYISIDIRKQTILKAVVSDYVQTAEPVGSSSLAARYRLGVKSATVRNEMAELASMGLLCQPHTSAGRIPSDQGYRYFVDRLMDAIAVGQLLDSLPQYHLLRRQTEIEAIIAETCRLLSNISQCTSFATNPVLRESTITQIHAASVMDTRLLVILVMDSGRVLHHFVNIPTTPSKIRAERVQNFLSAKLSGLSVPAACDMCSAMDDSEDPVLAAMLKDVIDFIKQQCSPENESLVHMEGSNYIMQQPEFKDIERLEAVLSVLEERKALCELLSVAYQSPEVTVLIGSENMVSGMRDCSFVGARYTIRNRVAGTIGVLGPTRMDYPKAVAAVRLISRSLEDILTAMSLS